MYIIIYNIYISYFIISNFIIYIYIYIYVCVKRNMKSFSNEILNFFVRKFWVSYILDLAKTVTLLYPCLRIC